VVRTLPRRCRGLHPLGTRGSPLHGARQTQNLLLNQLKAAFRPKAPSQDIRLTQSRRLHPPGMGLATTRVVGQHCASFVPKLPGMVLPSSGVFRPVRYVGFVSWLRWFLGQLSVGKTKSPETCLQVPGLSDCFAFYFITPPSCDYAIYPAPRPGGLK